MARKKKSTKPYRARWEPHLELEPQTIREIVGVLLIMLGLLTLLAALNLGGPVGTALFSALRFSFGWFAFAIPLCELAVGAALFFPERYPVKFNTVLGLVLVTLSSSGLLHLMVGEDTLGAAQSGVGGGMLGFFLNVFFLKFFSTAAVVVFYGSAFIIGILVTVNTRLSFLLNKLPRRLPSRPENAVVVNEPAAAVISKSFKKFVPQPEQKEPALSTYELGDWTPYGLELLEETTTKPLSGNIQQNVEVIKRAMTSFGIPVQMGEVNVGPTVTQYTLKPEDGVKLNQIVGLSNDLALALAAHPIRIEAPIPGRSWVGIEVPNQSRQIVRLRDLLTSPEFTSAASALAFPLGRAVSGAAAVVDFKTMPHLLIAGATNSGKSVAINGLLLSLLYRNSPNDLRVILVDPKRVELSHYNGIPHLLSPVITEPDKTISALKWTISEMERRFKLFQEVGKRNIDEYNRSEKAARLPYILLVIDELADLMAVAASEVEGLIVRLAQMARATGIHLLLATQRPSVDVITGLIKANITARMAFTVASQVDSKTILDMGGAEKLLGRGDMLFTSTEFIKPRRIQGVYISEKEIKRVTEHLRTVAAPEYNSEVLTQPVQMKGGRLAASEFDAPDDDLFAEAAETVIRSGKASASLLQRRLRVGYARAARLLDLLEERGVIGPGEGAKPRDVLVRDLSELPEPSGAGDQE